MYPISCKYVLKSLHGQDSGFHFLIPDLKRSILSTSFIFAAILSRFWTQVPYTFYPIATKQAPNNLKRSIKYNFCF